MEPLPRTAAVLVILCAGAPFVPGQTGGERMPLVIQVGVNLIQIDAVVTDREGVPVRDLRAEDFILEVDGARQAILNAAFIERTLASPATGVSPPPGQGAGAQGPEAPGIRQDPMTVVFLVDDLSMSVGSMAAAKEALSGFLNDWSRFNPRAGLRTTSDSSPSFSLFVAPDRFAKAVSGLRYNINSAMAGRSARTVQNDANLTSHSLPDVDARALERLRRQVVSLTSTVNTLRAIPGRKAVVFIGEGFSLEESEIEPESDFPPLAIYGETEVEGALRSVAEVANRASVVLYTVDPRGLADHEASTVDGANLEQATSLGRSRRKTHRQHQATLQFLAEATAGLSTVNSNDLVRGLSDALRDQASYYLIGFEPPEKTFQRRGKRPPFHKIRLQVNRADLKVRTRAGFYGVTDDDVNRSMAR